MILAVSTLRPDLFAPSEIIDSWEKALLLFQAHEHLSESVRGCVGALQMMFQKIEQTQYDAIPGVMFDGGFPEPLDSSLFSLESMSWLFDGQNF